MLKGRLVMMMVVAVILIGTFSAQARAEYLGEFCWLAEQTGGEDPDPPLLLRLGMFYMGGTHIVVSGTLLEEGEQPFAVTGNLEILAGRLEGTLTGLATGAMGRMTLTMKIRIDLDLSGYFWTVETEFAMAGEGDFSNPEFLGTEGDLTFSPACTFL